MEVFVSFINDLDDFEPIIQTIKNEFSHVFIKDFTKINLENFFGGLIICSIKSKDDINQIIKLKEESPHKIDVLGLCDKFDLIKDYYEWFDDFLIGKEQYCLITEKVEKYIHFKTREMGIYFFEKEYARHKNDFQIAKQIQDLILKDIPPKWPNLEIETNHYTTGVIGGDLWDFQTMSNGHLGIFLADVSGHGIGSALIAAMAKIMCKTFTSEIKDPKYFIKRLNSMMTEILMPVGKFLTAFYGIFHKYELKYVNGGHIAPLFYSPGEDRFLELENTSCILGYSKKIPIEVQKVTFNPGDILLFFTDGLIESKNLREEMLGLSQFKNLVREHHQEEKLGKKLIKEIKNFAGSVEMEDDITLLVIRVS